MVGKTFEGELSVAAKGFGFVAVEGLEADIFVEAHQMKSALNKDTVKVKVMSEESNGRLKGRILDVVARGITEIVGTFVKSSRGLRVIPDDEKLSIIVRIDKAHALGAKVDDKVKVQIVDYKSDGVVDAIVTTVLGNKDLPGIDILSKCLKHGIDVDFNEDTLAEAARVSDVVNPDHIPGRIDLRQENIFTIDGADAKDLDDAVGVKKLDNGNYELTVSIADVTHYVKEGSALDNEALSRGTSVYLTDRVVPMLPKNLSNGICSLNPQVDRLTLTCRMQIDRRGKVTDYEIFESVIKTKRRMTYTDVTAILDGDAELRAEYSGFIPDFELMLEIAEKLKKRREDRGSIEFDVKEAKIEVDEDGKPLAIHVRDRQVSEEIIEEFMLLANETVAQHFVKAKLPSIYRVHETPSAKRLQNLSQMMDIFGYNFSASEKVTPKELQLLLYSTRDSKIHASINKTMLRSMEKARYAEENLGHFGLAATYYTHFTSPIRRYPDLILHRMIRRFIINGEASNPAVVAHYEELLPEVAKHTSKKERGAIDCERDVMSMKFAEYMMDHISEVFDGLVSSVTKWGMYIELPNTIEGLIRLSALSDDFYEFDPERMRITGKSTGRTFKIGDSIKVKVKAANKDEGTIDFVVDGMKADPRVKLMTSEHFSGRKHGRGGGGHEYRESNRDRKKGRGGGGRSRKRGRR